jgi:hypothetical protein
MGLDLLVLGKPKQGFEREFELAISRLNKSETLSESEEGRFRENVSLPYQELGAPRVGFDRTANDWMVQSYRSRGDQTSEGQIIKDNQGYYVLSLLQGSCDGVPLYSNGGAYDGVDQTSFRGQFLEFCVDYLDKAVLSQAWTNVMTPEEAVSYGESLLVIANTPPKGARRGFLRKLFSGGQKATIEEQKNILTAAGKWYVFWGDRGHHIQAYF